VPSTSPAGWRVPHAVTECRVVRGGESFEECFFGCEDEEKGEDGNGNGGSTGPATFDEFLAQLAGAEHHYDRVANLRLRGKTPRRWPRSQPSSSGGAC
jgi:hypothetical protein